MIYFKIIGGTSFLKNAIFNVYFVCMKEMRKEEKKEKKTNKQVTLRI